MKPKAQTMAQKFGFADPDLTTPKHDAIMMWLDTALEKAFAQKIYGNHPDYVWNWEWCGGNQWEWDRNKEKLQGLLREGKIVIDASAPVQVIKSKVWEIPIVDRTYTIGFADMRIVYASCVLDTAKILKILDQPEEGIIFPIRITGGVASDDYRIRFFEVKPTIPSLGEVIRQIRMYQTYTGNAEWWIASPDTRFKNQIEAQGIKFLTVPADV